MEKFVTVVFVFFVSCSSDQKSETVERCSGSNPICFSGLGEDECSVEVDEQCEFVSCADVGIECWTEEYLNRAWGEDCNNTSISCPIGYSSLFDIIFTPGPGQCTTVGEGTCVASLEGPCLDPAVCDCTPCNGPEVQSCDGDPECFELESCGETKFCTNCPNPPCFDRESARFFCGDGNVCREEACPSNSSPYFCGPDPDCPAPPDCPNGFTICTTESATCVSTKTCGTTVLCEAN